jgi:uncharacterized protein
VSDPLVRASAIFGAAFAAGLIGAGAFVAHGAVHAGSGDRIVTVKGVSERDVKADLASLPLSVSASSNAFEEAQQRVDRDLATLRRFLTEQGYAAGEVEVGRYSLHDGYVGVEVEDRPALRWTAMQSVSVRTGDVDRVNRTVRALNDLMRTGDIGVDYSQPSYYFTRLDDLRGPMIGEATASARRGAQAFAKDSGAAVGGIKEASQGSFEIDGRDPAAGDESGQVFKRVRVVTTVRYQLK